MRIGQGQEHALKQVGGTMQAWYVCCVDTCVALIRPLRYLLLAHTHWQFITYNYHSNSQENMPQQMFVRNTAGKHSFLSQSHTWMAPGPGGTGPDSGRGH